MSKYIAIVSVALSCSQMPSGVLGLNPTTSPAGKRDSTIIIIHQCRMDKGERSDFLWNLPQRVFGGSYVQVGSAGDTSFLDTGIDREHRILL